MERVETLGVVEFGVPVRDGSDPSDELVEFLTSEGVVGAVNVLAGDSSSEVYGILFVDESGAPALWFPDEGAVGFGRGELEEFRSRLRERFGAASWIVEPDSPGDGPGPLAQGWGIRSFAWYTESQQFGSPEIVARALGGPVIWAPLGSGLLLVPSDPQSFVFSGYWRRGRSVLMWATHSRRAFAAANGRFRSDFRWWDQHFEIVDPSDGWQVDQDGFTVRQIVEGLLEVDPAFTVMTKAARIRADRRQEFRVELRKPTSSLQTFERMAEYSGVPAEVALVADGRLDPLELPGAMVAEPATMAEGIWGDTRIPLRGPFRVFQWWSRATERRPLWHRIATAGVVVAAIVLTAVVIVQGRPAEFAFLPLMAAGVWVLDFLRPRSRSAAGPHRPGTHGDAGTERMPRPPADRMPRQ
ncbi:hypothetical protein [Agromyces mariniharenae]|uniref:Uncharacterized protein n=1 Tax=Agromyces mariniharenae TaxID=2604423 RepID=A0A5S4V455_9MICO|nr:hypothetical protein [Agromyces mariniharenae]TYL53786.1 hypothetical protein FYC51_09135 [Agromyces mariniharenae]